MPPKPIPIEQLQAAVDAIHKYGTPYSASTHVGVNKDTLRHRRNVGLAQGLTPSKDIVPQHPGAGSTLYGPDGEIKLQWVKTKEDKEQFKKVLMEMIESFKQTLPKVKHRKPEKKSYSKKLMSVIPWGDPHFGLYCWAEEVGNDFNLDIAESDLRAAVKYLVSQSPSSERCVLLNLGDFFHSDDGFTTYRGTRVDTDTRIAKVVRVGVNAIRTAIECALERHKTVEIINSIGNHDTTLSMCLSILLSHVYEKEPRVIVHDQPTSRHYIRHGKVLIGVTHGDKAGKKESDLPGIMATERPQDWGETEYRFWYKGHLHHSKKTEYNGATVEMFRTITPGDEYSVSHGWLSMQDMCLICMHSDYGEVSRVTCSINMLRDFAK